MRFSQYNPSKILGTGMISFAPGKDGRRDGKFTGTAQDFPDNINPWSEKFIIQAKHTNKSKKGEIEGALVWRRV